MSMLWTLQLMVGAITLTAAQQVLPGDMTTVQLPGQQEPEQLAQLPLERAHLELETLARLTLHTLL